MSFITGMKDKQKWKKKRDVVHQGYERQTEVEKEEGCRSSRV
ncbi:hypothetical protein [Neobacillus sp. LXY-1]